MLDYNDIQRVHIEISDICNAACPMCGRFQGGGKQMFPHLNNVSMSLQKFKQVFDADFIRQIKEWMFCGVYGDPCTAIELPDIISYIVSINKDVKIGVETNGGLRNVTWWVTLSKLLNSKNCYVKFSVDGLEDTNHIYRRNVNWQALIKNIKTFVDNGGHAKWQFIRFKHNQHQVEQTQALAKELGVHTFIVKDTNRFRRKVEDEYKFPVKELGNDEPSYWLYPPDDFIPKPATKRDLDSCVIECKIQKIKEVFVTPTGEVFPCCFIFSDTKEQPQRYAGLDLTTLQATEENTIKDIVSNKIFKHIESSWIKSIDNGRNVKCAEICGINNRVEQKAVNI